MSVKEINLGMAFYKLVICIFILFLSVSCEETSDVTHETEAADDLKEEEKPKVSVVDLNTGVFYKEILSNGKLYAIRKADIRFRVSEVIDKINVKNGDMVREGAVLATLTNYPYKLRLQKARASYDKAKVDRQDVLIGQGYTTTDSTKIPVHVWKIAGVRSGLDNAVFDLQNSEYDFKNTVLLAPFSGTVCNVKIKEKNMPTTDPFCTLVDNSIFEASFQVLESELKNLTTNQSVQVIPFVADSTVLLGTITEINPIIDENGLVTVKARVVNSNKTLFEGMNVRVIVRKAYPNSLVVPKSAVVLRTGKEVVFTLENGRSVWNYVKTVDENSTSYRITEGLKAGAKVIVKGSLNLGHDAEVQLIKE